MFHSDAGRIERIHRLSERIGDLGEGAAAGEMLSALCLAISAGITLTVPEEQWQEALAYCVNAIGANLGSERFKALQ